MLTFSWKVYKNYVLQRTIQVISIHRFHRLFFYFLLTNFLFFVFFISASFVLALQSTSRDPRQFKLKKYALSPGTSYDVQVTAATVLGSTGVATVSVYVDYGPVVVRVKGGLFRSSAIDEPLLLDASSSEDLNVDPVSRSAGEKARASAEEKLLSFSWDCIVVSVVGYGKSCNSILKQDAVLTSRVAVVNMTVDYLYQVNVVVMASDGRSSSASITVTPTFSGSAKVKIRSTLTKFNTDSTLKLVGEIRAGTAQTSYWSVLDPDVNLNIDSMTPVWKNFSAYEAEIGVLYPLAVVPKTFYPGKMYTFRLTSFSRNDSSMMGFGEILLTTNAPPSTGKLIVSPPNGTAVLTTFSISASSWIDDDLPLSYVFMYSLSDDQGDLTLAAKSQMTFTSSPLPAGLNSMNGIVNNCSLDFLNFSAINVLVCC